MQAREALVRKYVRFLHFSFDGSSLVLAAIQATCLYFRFGDRSRDAPIAGKVESGLLTSRLASRPPGCCELPD